MSKIRYVFTNKEGRDMLYDIFLEIYDDEIKRGFMKLLTAENYLPSAGVTNYFLTVDRKEVKQYEIG